MKEFVITANLYLTIQAESEEHAWAQLHKWCHDAPFAVETDWAKVEDSYDIDE